MRIAVVTALALLLGIAAGLSPSTESDVTRVPTRDDNAVIAVVLTDLLEYKGKDSPLGGFGPKKPITVHRVPASSGLNGDGFLGRLDSKPWLNVKAGYGRQLTQAVQDLARRAPDAEGQFEAAVDGVAWRLGRPKPSAESIFDRSIEFMLPGYSADGTLVVVSFHVPWSIHSVGATYALVSQGGTWKVLARQFDYYL